MGKTQQDHHNEGQSDGSKGEYNPPHGAGEELCTWNSDSLDKLYQDNESYREGYRSAQDQKD
jgi:hypothetical protein